MSSSTSLRLAAVAFAALAGQAMAADLPSKFSTPSSPFNGSQYEWSGFYAGATADYVPGFKGTGDLAKSVASMLNPKGRGYEGSLFGGINKQYGSYVIGAEADLTMGRIDDRRSYSDQTGTANVKFHQDIAGSIRARFGYTFNDVMIFATSGLAVSQNKLTSDINTAGYSAATNATRIEAGYTLGGGVEYGYSRSLLFRTEYRYTQYGKTSFNGVKLGTEIQEVRSGLAYKF